MTLTPGQTVCCCCRIAAWQWTTGRSQQEPQRWWRRWRPQTPSWGLSTVAMAVCNPDLDVYSMGGPPGVTQFALSGQVSGIGGSGLWWGDPTSTGLKEWLYWRTSGVNPGVGVGANQGGTLCLYKIFTQLCLQLDHGWVNGEMGPHFSGKHNLRQLRCRTRKNRLKPQQPCSPLLMRNCDNYSLFKTPGAGLYSYWSEISWSKHLPLHVPTFRYMSPVFFFLHFLWFLNLLA